MSRVTAVVSVYLHSVPRMSHNRQTGPRTTQGGPLGDQVQRKERRKEGRNGKTNHNPTASTVSTKPEIELQNLDVEVASRRLSEATAPAAGIGVREAVGDGEPEMPELG